MDSINKIFKVIKHMNTHLEDKLSLDDLCVVSGYTKSHLCYLFKFYIGETPNKYFYQQKLKYAADILTGDEKVLDIAVKIGFESHEAFTRAFKKEFGITPVEYRELHKKGLSKLSELSDVELIVLFEPSPAYRRDYLGLDLYGKYYDIYQSLIRKGFISEIDLELEADGVGQRDKYYWDCSKIIIELSKTYDTPAELYKNSIELTYMPKLLFFKFLYGLVEMGKVKNIFIGCCGSDCFKCDTLRASIEDDDDLRKEIAEHSKT